MTIADWMQNAKMLLAFASGRDGVELVASIERLAGKGEQAMRLVKEIAQELRENTIPHGKKVAEILKQKGIL